ncbi:MAG: hypothetical protein M1833_002938 [Piccolia ochrophora]|nr:MAG: hypothetical protein M1833_002938 [Piccolia ochrophora]
MDPYRYRRSGSPPGGRRMVDPMRSSTGTVGYSSYDPSSDPFYPRSRLTGDTLANPRSSADHFDLDRRTARSHRPEGPYANKVPPVSRRPRRSTLDTEGQRPPRPVISTALRPVVHSGAPDRPASPSTRSYDSDAEGEYYLTPATSGRRGHQRNYSLDNEGASRGANYREPRDVAPDRSGYRSPRSAGVRKGYHPSGPLVRSPDVDESRHRFDDYRGYEYTDPREEEYRDPQPGRRRGESLEVPGRERPISMIELEGYLPRTAGPREPGPPPSTRGFDRIPRSSSIDRKQPPTREREDRDYARPREEIGFERSPSRTNRHKPVSLHQRQDDPYESHPEDKGADRPRHDYGVDRRDFNAPRDDDRHRAYEPNDRDRDRDRDSGHDRRHHHQHKDDRDEPYIRPGEHRPRDTRERDDLETERRKLDLKNREPREKLVAERDDVEKERRELDLRNRQPREKYVPERDVRDRDRDYKERETRERAQREKGPGEREIREREALPTVSRGHDRPERELLERDREVRARDLPEAGKIDKVRTEREHKYIDPQPNPRIPELRERDPVERDQADRDRRGRDRIGSDPRGRETVEEDSVRPDRRNDHVRVVSPPRERESKPPIKGILREPRQKFPEDPAPIREGVAPLKDAKDDKKGIPPGARWTKIDRRLVNPATLEEAQERFEERLDHVIVLRVLKREEIEAFAARTQEIRDARFGDKVDRDRRDRHRRRTDAKDDHDGSERRAIEAAPPTTTEVDRDDSLAQKGQE